MSDFVKKVLGLGNLVQSSSFSPSKDIIKTISPSVNYLMGGGIKSGRFYCMEGVESCLDENTFIDFDVFCSTTGKPRTNKGGTIKKLYQRFNKIYEKGSRGGIKGTNVNKQKNDDAIFLIPSINEAGCIFMNRVADVVKCGIKDCYKVTTFEGKELISTLEHKYYTKDGYKSLKDLKIEDEIYIHNNTRFKKDKKVFKYFEVMVKYHPSNHWHSSGKHKYCRIKRSRLVYEASINNLDYQDYISFLNTASKEEIEANIKILPRDRHIHHLDENHSNDVIENLVEMSGKEHNKLHSLKNHNFLRFISVLDKIKKIEYVGEKETYDIKCLYPYNNYVANGIVVHNSGKSFFTLSCIKSILEKFKDAYAIWFDTEYSFERHWLDVLMPDKQMQERLLLRQTNRPKDIIDFFDGELIPLVKKGFNLKACVIDSVNAMRGPKEQKLKQSEAHVMGDLSQYLPKALRWITAPSREHGITWFFISQVRLNMDPSAAWTGKKFVISGGQAYKHALDLELSFEKRGAKDTKIFNEGAKTITGKASQMGHRVMVKCVKNRIGIPSREAEFDLHYNYGVINTEEELAKLIINIGLIKQEGNTYYGDDGEKIAVGFDKTIEVLASNPELMEKYEAKMNSLEDLKEIYMVDESKEETEEDIEEVKE